MYFYRGLICLFAVIRLAYYLRVIYTIFLTSMFGGFGKGRLGLFGGVSESFLFKVYTVAGCLISIAFLSMVPIFFI